MIPSEQYEITKAAGPPVERADPDPTKRPVPIPLYLCQSILARVEPEKTLQWRFSLMLFLLHAYMAKGPDKLSRAKENQWSDERFASLPMDPPIAIICKCRSFNFIASGGCAGG